MSLDGQRHYVLLERARGSSIDPELSTAFENEARRLRQLREGEQTLTTLQATTIMGFTYIYLGKDKIGFSLVASTVQMAADMGLIHRGRDGVKDRALFDAQQTTIWALFKLVR